MSCCASAHWGATASPAPITAASGGSAPPSLTDNKLDVMQWNVHQNIGTDGGNLPLRVASHMALQNADVISINELPTTQSVRDQMRAHLIAVSGQQWSDWYFDENGSNGNGIIVRSSACSVSSWTSQELSGVQASDRSIVQATVNFNGKTVNVFSRHLDSSSAPESSRVTQVGEIATFTAPYANPKIIVGDFNTTNTSTLSGITVNYHDAWAWGISNYTPDRSFKYTDNTGAYTRANRIDYHFFSPKSQPAVIELVEARIVDTRDMFTYVSSGVSPNVTLTVVAGDDKGVRPSDHNMIMASFLVP